MSAAVECIRDIFPQSAVKTIRVDKYPFRVTITAEGGTSGKSHNVWSGKQVNLYEKYPKRRRKAMDIIRTKLADLKDMLTTGPSSAAEKTNCCDKTEGVNANEQLQLIAGSCYNRGESPAVEVHHQETSPTPAVEA